MYEQHLYKEQLYNSLANDNNLVDNVKLQLRQKIINKLKTTSSNSAKIIQPEKQLIRKVCCSLFMEYLNKQRLFHTVAVFNPECGFSKNLFNDQELSQLFRINNSKYGQTSKQNLSTLQAVINTFLPKGRLYERTVSTSCQTDDKETIQNLQNKLQFIEFQYKQKTLDSLKTVEDSEQRFLKYKNQLNKRYKDELASEIKRIRDFQISQIRMEESEKNRIKMRDYEQELELNYRSKMEKLRERQADVMTRVANKMKEVQTYNYQARQRMLNDLQSIKVRQQELERMKQQLFQKERKLVKERQNNSLSANN